MDSTSSAAPRRSRRSRSCGSSERRSQDDKASLAMPLGGRGGFAAATVETRGLDRLTEGLGRRGVKAAVVGGGLAGLAAALELVDAGHEVTLYEARPTLGGKVQTLPPRDGDPDPPPDNGQHIALGCFAAYLRFLERIGSAGKVRRAPLALPVIDERGRVATIGYGLLPLLRYRHVSLGDRLRIVRFAARVTRIEPSRRTFGELLRAAGQSEAAIDRFWEVFLR